MSGDVETAEVEATSMIASGLKGYMIGGRPMGSLVWHQTLNKRAKTTIVDELDVRCRNPVRFEAMIHAREENTNAGSIGDLSQREIGNLMHGDVEWVILNDM